MSALRHSRGERRESLRPRYEYQDFILYRTEGTQGSFSEPRTLDMNVSRHDSPVHRERRYRPSHVPGYSSSRSQRDDSPVYSNTTTRRSGSSLELVHFDPKRQKGRKSKPREDSIQVQRSWVETPTLPRSSTIESLGPTKLPSSQRIREKTVRFDDKVCLNAGSPERLPGTVGHRRGVPRGQSEDYHTGVSGNVDTTGELHHCGAYSKNLPKRSHAGIWQGSHPPPAPMIPRLPTPDFESPSHYELSLAKRDFCLCCSSDDRDDEDRRRWKQGKAKMEKQVDNARAYISRMTIGERMIADA
ncbi:hypothetical protein F5Y12DRAFT_187059 [Xylaria sp. FL1777]|nr:hypothetical protein F5Y12DRAFT_187059 [Xylaria sp. FL1777]